MPKKYERNDGSQSFKGVESLTQQSDKPLTNIRSILRQGVEAPDLTQMSFGDFSNAEDFHESMVRIANAQTEFAALPSNVRDYFNNDPEQLIGALDDIQSGNDDRTRQDLVEMGFMKEKPASLPEDSKPLKEAKDLPKKPLKDPSKDTNVQLPT